MPVAATNGRYTTPALTENSDLEITFSVKPPVLPTILSANPNHVDRLTITVHDSSGGQTEITLNTSFINYATISNPDNYTIVGFGMLLKDVETGKVIDLPAVRKTSDGQFAIHIFGDGFTVGKTYSLCCYLNYTDNGQTHTVFGEEKTFVWEASKV